MHPQRNAGGGSSRHECGGGGRHDCRCNMRSATGGGTGGAGVPARRRGAAGGVAGALG